MTASTDIDRTSWPHAAATTAGKGAVMVKTTTVTQEKEAARAASTSKELKDTLWKAADKLRGSMDASQYKDVVLGLVF